MTLDSHDGMYESFSHLLLALTVRFDLFEASHVPLVLVAGKAPFVEF